MGTTTKLAGATIAKRLNDELPHWQLQQDQLQRTYTTAGWKSTLMVINAIGHLAEAAWHHPDIEAGYKSVKVKLTTHSAGGITALDFELAAKIESLIQWQPATQPGALEGTPDDDRYRYIRYDAD